jgi:hypothetical protein
MRQPGCTACEALPGRQDCGGHWSTKTAVHTYGRRSRATLDNQETRTATRTSATTTEGETWSPNRAEKDSPVV